MFACLRCGSVCTQHVYYIFAITIKHACFVNDFAWNLYVKSVSYVCVEFDVGNQRSVFFQFFQRVLYLFVSVGSYILLFRICVIA